MIGWQDAAVFLIVFGAVAFLVRRIVPSRASGPKGTQTFVPMGSIKRRREHDRDGCH